MGDISKWPLEDAVLERVSVDWGQRVLRLDLVVSLEPGWAPRRVAMEWSELTRLELPCERPDAESERINEARRSGPGRYEVEMSSGDVIAISARRAILRVGAP